MKTRNIVSTVIVATALFTQAAFASSNTPAPSAVDPDSQQAATQQTVVKVNEVTGSSESYAELLQRIKEDSLRQLTDKLNTEELIGDAISATVRSLIDATLAAKPQI